jgi:hypothetical protein
MNQETWRKSLRSKLEYFEEDSNIFHISDDAMDDVMDEAEKDLEAIIEKKRHNMSKEDIRTEFVEDASPFDLGFWFKSVRPEEARKQLDKDRKT